MNFKRIFIMVLALLMLASSLFGCKTDPTVSQEEPQTPTLKINGVALSEYTIVYNTGTALNAKEVASYFNQKIEEAYGVTLETAKTVLNNRYEIVIGLDAGDTAIAKEYEENSLDGFIGVSGKRIILLGRTYAILCQEVDTFLAKAAGADANKEISMTANERLTVAKSSIKVLTYNLQEDLNKAGRRDDCLTEIIATIKTQDPDVFGTQENTAEIHASLGAGLSEYTCYKGVELNDKTKLGNYVYYKTDKFNVIKKGYYYMSNTPGVKSKLEGSNGYRAFTYLILEVKETGKQFLFVDIHTHYKYENDNIPEETVRTNQLKVVTKLLKTINKTNLPMVMLGDFNTTETGDALLSFLQDNPTFALSSKVAETKGDTGGTLATTEFTVRSKYIFDHIIVSPNNSNTVYYSVIDNIKTGKYPSDHLPVVAHIDIY